ncbi:unnamed protein product [marine sediment metagenome]|uniref:Uncharacterized protein n=1 Tax=marine sediment metagenome TaxID=412755 RepID=X1NFI4_9ZZZZ
MRLPSYAPDDGQRGGGAENIAPDSKACYNSWTTDNKVAAMTDSPVLVLNQSYEPLNLCRTRRAIVLIFRGKAEVLENSRG